MYAFKVFTSSALNVSTSGTFPVWNIRPSFRNFWLPSFKSSRASVWLSKIQGEMMIVHRDEVPQAVRETFPASFAEVCHNALLETVSILFLIREQFQRIDQIFAQALRYRMRFEDFACSTLSPVCTTKSLFGCFQSYFSPQIAHHQLVYFCPVETHQTKSSRGKLLQFGHR